MFYSSKLMESVDLGKNRSWQRHCEVSKVCPHIVDKSTDNKECKVGHEVKHVLGSK